MENENQTTGAPGGSEPGSPAAPAAPPAPTDASKFEVKEGAMTVDSRKVVFESDLIAAKESLKTQSDKAQAVHSEAMDKIRVELSGAQQATAEAGAKLKLAEDARSTGAISADELAKVRQEVDDAKGVAEKATTISLEYHRKLIAITYQVPIEQLADKDAAQLDSFEEAIKAVTQSRGGPGNYAVGGGGEGATPKSPMDRARELIASTPQRGVRSETPNK